VGLIPSKRTLSVVVGVVGLLWQDKVRCGAQHLALLYRLSFSAARDDFCRI
jgi:hypothetical protein